MMIKTLIAAALVAGAMPSVDAGTLQWIKANAEAGAEGMCAGGYESCASKEECTYTGLGPCAADETTPKWHLASSFVGLAFVADGYTKDATKATIVEAKPGAKGFRKAEAGQTDAGQADKTDGTEYAYAMASNMFGKDATAYGYAGIASYLNTGTKDISVNTNKFYGFDGDYNTDFQSPKEYSICTSPMSGTECGAKRTFKPGAYKFSLFGNNLGSGYAAAIANMGDRKSVV